MAEVFVAPPHPQTVNQGVMCVLGAMLQGRERDCNRIRSDGVHWRARLESPHI